MERYLLGTVKSREQRDKKARGIREKAEITDYSGKRGQDTENKHDTVNKTYTRHRKDGEYAMQVFHSRTIKKPRQARSKKETRLQC